MKYMHTMASFVEDYKIISRSSVKKNYDNRNNLFY